MLDLPAGARTDRTALEPERRTPLPFPPEPARSVTMGIAQWALTRAGAGAGQPNPRLRTPDRSGPSIAG
ncbi:hypothetical protein ACFV4F_40285 [Kitasatospora sp. NPDC059722]|uniref:hypothetical protein n=1 Tax=Kitasatospora sp. NPDC059722 TaxID=3346925 RepID=UPI0036C372F7